MQRVLFSLLSISLLLTSAPAAAAEPAEFLPESGALTWQVKVPFESATLNIRGPGVLVKHQFAPAQTLRVAPVTADGQPFPDGRYFWELSLRPVLSGPARQAIEQAQGSGSESERAYLRSSGLLPAADLGVSGGFNLVDGAPVGSGIEQAPPSGPGTLDDVIDDDLIVEGNVCLGGINCVNGESFGNDQIKVKDFLLGILFEDTSSEPFPTNDWRIKVNDGNSEFFAIEDVETERIPFRIHPGVRDDAFVITGNISSASVGIGTAVPLRTIHSVAGDSPSLRLDQDGSSGFEPQVWDLRGNESHFFITDATALTIPFEIETGAPDASLLITEDGNIGLGTEAPEDTLHIAGGLVVDGDLRISSSGKRKENIEPVAHAELLETVAALELFRWNYKTDPNKTRHLGPLAEDFYTSFNLGHDERHVSPGDVAGVALAAVQALQEELRQRDRKLDELTTVLRELQREMQVLRDTPPS